MTARMALLVQREVDHLLEAWANSPGMTSGAEAPVVKRLMVKTEGRVYARGVRYDIKAKPLGAGAYRLSLQRGGE